MTLEKVSSEDANVEVKTVSCPLHAVINVQLINKFLPPKRPYIPYRICSWPKQWKINQIPYGLQNEYSVFNIPKDLPKWDMQKTFIKAALWKYWYRKWPSKSKYKKPATIPEKIKQKAKSTKSQKCPLESNNWQDGEIHENILLKWFYLCKKVWNKCYSCVQTPVYAFLAPSELYKCIRIFFFSFLLLLAFLL